jgi:hypothetical protein
MSARLHATSALAARLALAAPVRPAPPVLAAGVAVVLLLVPVAPVLADGQARRSWLWPVRGEVIAAFHVTPRTPYAAGQRRGIRIAAAPGTAVRAVCGGRVSFTGSVGAAGPTVSVRCGALTATYQGIGAPSIRRGGIVAPGTQIATVGSAGRLHLGARRVDRRTYVDPLTLLAQDPPMLGPAPTSRPPAKPPRGRVRPTPLPLPAAPPLVPARRSALARVPWSAWLGLGLVAAGIAPPALARRRRARRLVTPLPANRAV